MAVCSVPCSTYTKPTNDSVAGQSSNSILKFRDDTTIVGQITGNDESELRREINLYQNNNLDYAGGILFFIFLSVII